MQKPHEPPANIGMSDDSVVPQLISVHDLATILRVSPRTIWRLLSAGKIVRPVYIGGSARWRYDEVQRWISNDCPATNEASQADEVRR